MQCIVVLYKQDPYVERGLPHTSNSLNLEDYNSVLKTCANLKFSPVVKLCWCSLMTKFQVSSIFQSQVMDCQSS